MLGALVLAKESRSQDTPSVSETDGEKLKAQTRTTVSHLPRELILQSLTVFIHT